jgi:hypothetical protein
MARDEMRFWPAALLAAAVWAAAAPAAACSRPSEAAPNPPPQTQLYPIPVELMAGGQAAPVGADRLLVALPGTQLGRVLSHIDGDNTPRDVPITIFELRAVGVCPTLAQCHPCDPQGGECTGIPPLPRPRWFDLDAEAFLLIGDP